LDDSKIIELYFERSEKAIEETQAKYDKLCVCIANNILNNEEDAKECCNDTYLKVWNTIPPLRPASLYAYISKVVRNTALHKYEYYHAQKRNNEFDMLLSELEECFNTSDNIEVIIDNSVISNAISEFLYSIKNEARNIFIQRYYYSESIRNLCNHYGMSKSKIESMLHRTRIKLKEYLEKEGISL